MQRIAKTANQQVALATFASSGMGKAFGRGARQTCGMTVYAAPRRLEQMSNLASLGDVALHMDITR